MHETLSFLIVRIMHENWVSWLWKMHENWVSWLWTMHETLSFFCIKLWKYILEFLKNAYMKFFWECMNAWNFLVCIYWCMRFYFLLWECMNECMKLYFFSVLIFVWMSSWMNAWDSISYFCFFFEWVHEWIHETLFFTFECMYKCMRFCFSFLNEYDCIRL